jgi:ABC-type nitrate/sulfonate/bicarbonate transport system substrate-binding protein
LKDRHEDLIEDLNVQIIKAFRESTKKIEEESENTVKKCERIISEARENQESYFNRSKFKDRLVYINLLITPILLIILSYVVFIKK